MVETETLDAICHDLNVIPQFIKIDAEGSEDRILDPSWIKIDYYAEIRPNPETYVFPELAAIFERHRSSIMRFYTALCPWMDSRALKSITGEQVDDKTPYWDNGYFSWGDARSAYAITAYIKPRIILEIGSGHSTRFFRKAITDHNTPTRLLCIDPEPRADIA